MTIFDVSAIGLTPGSDGHGPAFQLPVFETPVSGATGCGDSFTGGMILGAVGWLLEDAA